MTPNRHDRGREAHRRGHSGEWLAAAWLLLHGWRIVGFRVRTPQGEIDLLARRGRVLAVVEVKHRRTVDEALAAVGHVQQRRLAKAAAAVCAQRVRWRNLAIRLDLIALAPRKWPVHVPDAWRMDG
jgi:putative endonuclease